MKKTFQLYLVTPLSDILVRIRDWETWPWLVKYIPLMPFWAWYCIRSRSFWFFTSSNPTLTFGGFEGESKKEMYAQLPPESYPKTCYISATASFQEVKAQFAADNFTYPVAVKPDVGRMGFMFRKINSADELYHYHRKMKVDYILQEFADDPIEVSVFYYRFPTEKKGTITGFVRKDYLEVKGDGRSTLAELIANYQRVRFRQEEMRSKHADKLNCIIPEGQAYVLSHALNLSRGGKLVSLAHERDERLLKIFDDLSHYAKHFYYGRYDIKCASIEDLKNGRFKILEYNGSGAEPHHVYGNGNSLYHALKILVHHWDILFQISKHNNQNGIPSWSFLQGCKFLKEARRHFSILKHLDKDLLLLPSQENARAHFFTQPSGIISSQHD